MIDVSAEQRKSTLATAIRNEVANGAHVESRTDYEAVVRYDPKINHTLHFIITLVTFGMWGFVWIVLYAIAASGRKVVALSVDPEGNLLREKL